MDLPIVRGPRLDKNFTTLSNETLNASIKPDALGVWLHLLSKPDNWEVVPKALQNHFGIGRDALRRIFRDLQDHGVMVKRPRRGEGGRVEGWEYVIYETPQPKDGLSGARSTEALENRTTGEPNAWKPVPLQRTDLLQRTKYTNTHSGGASLLPPGDWEPDPKKQVWLCKQKPGVDYEKQLARFRLNEQARPKTKWQQAWELWWGNARPERSSGKPRAEVVQRDAELEDYLNG